MQNKPREITLNESRITFHKGTRVPRTRHTRVTYLQRGHMGKKKPTAREENSNIRRKTSKKFTQKESPLPIIALESIQELLAPSEYIRDSQERSRSLEIFSERPRYWTKNFVKIKLKPERVDNNCPGNRRIFMGGKSTSRTNLKKGRIEKIMQAI